MDYYELTFTYQSSVEKEIVHDLLAAELGEVGFESFVEADDGLRGYVSEKEYDVGAVESRLAAFPLEGVAIRFTEKRIVGKDWNEEWEKNYFKPIEIGDECVIHASFHDVKPGFRYDITINPKMAFGTGNHETTYLMISEMLRLELAGEALLDMGCGTGVLAILASMKGADPVVAIDIDEWAYDNAIENSRLNHAGGIEVRLGGAERIPASVGFDLIFANINRNILLSDIRHYALGMKRGASLYMSGFYTGDIPVIEAECARQGLRLLSSSERNGWAVVRVEKE
ncbi:MAG: 50S ribosomal protein L11 methyltransferase [Tannerellaceae bacterium]|jgi:ribosomal protein L11 methyltransferase|nr:50S ribosomal protein L11 methyltransferase [Tannerellaceae bacterium]